MNRYRPIAGRILMELLYGEGPHLSCQEGTITVELTGLARVIHVRPIRIVETLEWMESRGLLSMEHHYRAVAIRLKGSARINHVD